MPVMYHGRNGEVFLRSEQRQDQSTSQLTIPCRKCHAPNVIGDAWNGFICRLCGAHHEIMHNANPTSVLKRTVNDKPMWFVIEVWPEDDD